MKKIGSFRLCLIFCFITICFAQTPFLQTYNINSVEDGEYFALGNLNIDLTFQSNLNLATTLTENCNVTLCFSYLLAPYPNVLLWEEECDFLYDISETSPTSFLLSPLLGFYQIHAFSQYQNCNVTIEATGNQCPNNTYGENCSAALPFPQLDQLTVPAGSELTFYYSSNRTWTSNLQFIVECEDNSEIKLYGRLGNVAYINDGIFDLSNDTISNQSIELNFPYPRKEVPNQQNPFLYFITVVNQNPTNDTKINIFPVVTVCDEYNIGINCSTIVPPMMWSGTYEISTNDEDDNGWFYGFLFVPVEEEETFNFGCEILSEEGYQSLDEDIKIYWRFGNIPTEDNYDLVLYSTSEVTLPNPFFYSAEETILNSATYWYFAISDTQKRSFGLWFSADCPYDCSGAGTCNTTSHVCDCDSDQLRDFGCVKINNGNNYYYDFGDDDGSSGTHWSYYVIVIEALAFFVIVLTILIGAAILKSKFSSQYTQI